MQKSMEYNIEYCGKFILNKQKVMTILITLFVLFSLVVPSFIANKVIFILIVLFYLGDLMDKKIFFVTYVPFVILFIFCFGLLQGLILGCDFSLAIQFFLSVSMLFIIYPIDFYKINLTIIIKKVSVVYLIFSCFFIIYGLNKVPFKVPDFIATFAEIFNNKLFNTIGDFINIYGQGAIGYRSFFGGVNCMIHIGSVPFLLIPISLYANELFKKSKVKQKKFSKFLFVIVGFLVSIVSTSRALIFCEIIAIILAFLNNCSSSVRLFVSFILLIAVAFFLNYLFTNSNIFSLSEKSNNIKLGHLKGYLEYINLKNFLIGDGLASYYHSFAYEGLHAHTEITLLDFMRYFGVIPAFVIYVMLFLPLKNKKHGFKRDKFTFAVFALYVVISLTNPVLFNSIGMIVILWCWNDVLMKRSSNNNKKDLLNA